MSVCAQSALTRVQQCGRSAHNGSFGRCADDGVLTSEQHLSKSDRDSITRHITCLGAGNACQSFLSRRTIKASFSGPSLFYLAASCPFYLEEEKKKTVFKATGESKRKTTGWTPQRKEINILFSLHVSTFTLAGGTSEVQESLQFGRIQVNMPLLAWIVSWWIIEIFLNGIFRLPAGENCIHWLKM